MRTEQKRSVFVEFAKGLASLSTCERRRVGCIITDLHEVYAIGYNGPPRGLPHGCQGEPGLCGCVHAEANAIAKLSSREPDLWLHSTLSPCVMCAGLIINRGNIKTVTYSEVYRDRAGLLLLESAGLNVYLF